MLSYYKTVLLEACREAIAIIKGHAAWDVLLILAGAFVGFLLGEPVGQLAGIFAGAIAALAVGVVVIGAWCIASAPVNISRSSLAENQALQATISSLQGQLDEGRDEVAAAIQELKQSGHFESFRVWGKEFIQGTYTLYSGFNQHGIRDLLMMKLIRAERIPNPPKPLEPLEPGAFRTGITEPPFHTLYLFTDLGAEVWKKIREDEVIGIDSGVVT